MFTDATTPAAKLRAYNAVLELLFNTAPMLHVLASRMDGSKGGSGKILNLECYTKILLEPFFFFTIAFTLKLQICQCSLKKHLLLKKKKLKEN